MIAHICAHPCVSSAPQAGGHCRKVGRYRKNFVPALCAGIRAPHFQFASGDSETEYTADIAADKTGYWQSTDTCRWTTADTDGVLRMRTDAKISASAHLCE